MNYKNSGQDSASRDTAASEIAAGADLPLIRVFGGMGIEQTAGPVSIGGPKLRRLLALLVVRSGSTVSIDWIAEHLWDDDDRPEPTAPTLRTYVSRLRRSLTQDWIATEPSGYRFTAPDEAIEHRRIALLRADARRARDLNDPKTAVDRLDEALALWRGDPFRELEDLDWARADIEQLQIDRLEMFEERWDSVLALGRHTQITGELAAFTTEHVLRDRAARQYALALHRSARTTEALRVIDEHRRTVADQSGLEPSSEIVELENALLRGDESLLVQKTGRPLRGYRLIEEIGTGAFSVVWRGVQPSVNRDVAVKQIRAELASQPEFIRRFEAEAQLVARIEHPHIVPMIDFWRDPDSAYLVMRWLRGGTLERRLDDGPMAIEAAMSLARQIGGALSAAHSRGVVHRDVKAANILFDEDGHAFLTDFGIALEVSGDGEPDELEASHLSPAYASPEQIRRDTLSPHSDQFSLGVVIFECLTGSLPFRDSSSLEQLVKRQMHAPFPSVSEWRPDVPAAIAEAIDKATAKDPAERFASVAELVEALDIGAGSGSTAKKPLQLSNDLENPYKGLRAFDDGDSDQFFGRERITNELIAHLRGDTLASRSLVVVGPSGSGKSSIVRAGLMPALRAGAVGGSEEWFSTVMVPGADPFESLEAALLRIAVNPPPSLIEQLRDGERGVLRGVRRCLASEDQTVLVVIDQFEEVFTAASSDDANAFLAALAVAVEEPSSPLRLVATLRADFYHRPLEHTAFAPILKGSGIEVTPMAGDELERAIVQPAERVGVEFEAGLVARIAAAAAGQPSPLPLLQYTLRELFDRRDENQLTLNAYDEMGGLSGALASRAETLYLDADDAERAAARRMFGRMTNPGEGSADLRRRVRVADLGNDATSTDVLAQFGSARLITLDRDVATREPTVEVAHEALLREWPRLVTWLNDDLEILRTIDALGVAAASWDSGGRDDSDLYRGGRLETASEVQLAAPERLRALEGEFVDASRSAAAAQQQIEDGRVRRLRRLVAGVGVALVLALVAGGIALRQEQRADDEATAARAAADRADEQRELALTAAEEAEEQRDRAEIATMVSTSAAHVADDPRIAVLVALEANRRAPGPETEQAVLNALGGSAVASQVSSIELQTNFDSPCPVLNFLSTGTIVYAAQEGTLLSQDLETGEMSEHGRTPNDGCVVWASDPELNVRVASDREGSVFFGPADGPWEHEQDFGAPTYLGTREFRPNNRFVVSTETGDGSVVRLLDDRTGETIGEPIEPGGFFQNYAQANTDGSLILLSFGIVNRFEGDGLLIALDGETGDEVFRVNSPVPSPNLAWDETTGQIVAVTDDGTLLTIDAVTGEITSTAETTASSRILDVGIREDGLVIVISEGQIELVDRIDGPIGEPVALAGGFRAEVRDDDTIMLVTFDELVVILDLEENAVVEQVFEVDAFALFAFNAGLAGAVTRDGLTDVADVIDLASGERWSLEFTTPDGEPFNPLKMYPEVDGMWAVGADYVVARWQDGEMVEKLNLDGEVYSGTRYLDRWALISRQEDGADAVDLLDLSSGTAELIVRVDAPDGHETHPALDGGVHIIDADGRLHTYDAAGNLTNEVETGAVRINVITVDPASGKIALGSSNGGVVLVDLATGEIEKLPIAGIIANFGFARDGELLVINQVDGTVRLWDVTRSDFGGVVWRGSGGGIGSPSWYDETTESIWVAVSGKVLQIPLNPQRWIDRACETVPRGFSPEEWDRYVPGDDPLWNACL